MALFISYSRQDAARLTELTAALHRSQHNVWMDQELGGGDAWWNTICAQILACDVFVIALSNNWMHSKPCQTELRYAHALNKPILPVRIGPVDNIRVNSLAELQIVDYEIPNAQNGIQLVTAVHALGANPRPLPEPLPEQPAVPYGYLMRLGDALAEKEISPQQQLQLLVELKSGLDEDGDDPGARSDIAQLLRMLRMRHDVTFRTRTEIDNVLASIEPAAATPEKSIHTQPSESRQHAADHVGAPSSARKRWIIAAAAAAAVVVVGGAAVLLTTQRSTPAAAPAPAKAVSAPAGAPVSPATLLLTPAEMGAVLGDTSLQATQGTAERPRTSAGTLSTPDCLGAFEPLEETVYQGAAGLVGVRGEPVVSGGSDPQHRIYQAVAQFDSLADAMAFVQRAQTTWQTCAGTDVTYATPQSSVAWTFSPLGGAVPKVWLTRRQAGAGGVSCHHALEADSNFVIDVQTCSQGDPIGAAGKVVGAISAKIPAE